MNLITFVRHIFRSVLLTGLVLVTCVSAFPVFAQTASAPAFFSYQGRLTDSSGNLLGGSGSTYFFKFSLWNNSVVGSGSRVWPVSNPTVVPMVVKQGLFNVNIGDVAGGYPDALTDVFNTTNLYLQVEVSSNGVTYETLSPRQSISSALFSQVSGRVVGAGQSAIGTTTPATDSVLTVEATTTTSVPVSIRGTSGQVADLLKLQDSNRNNLFTVSSNGEVHASSSLQVTGTTELYSTLTVHGLTSLQNASTTLLSAQAGVYVGNTTKTIILGDNATSTFAGGIVATNGVRVTAGGVRVDSLNCAAFANGGVLTTDSNGNVLCADDDVGVGGTGITSLNGLIAVTQTFATSSDANITLTVNSAGSVHTLTPAFVGTLSVARGGTGLSSITQNQILIGGVGNTVTQIATSSLGLLTTNVAEGSNLYYQDARVQTYLDTVGKGYFYSTTS
ncbi:MAG: hypothetical protein RLZZ67_550, partial [Candidatus Parcubacteria bacterium]